ncbi:MAG: acylphosphatase, partial [Candidatus Marinimicrobia bacterium]|nr:acylphosphatase [Candidatus Neomarinimicrobiota bacterium]
ERSIDNFKPETFYKAFITIKDKKNKLELKHISDIKDKNLLEKFTNLKNKNTNEVEAVFLGEEKKVDEIIKLCRNGPISSNVESVKIEDYKQEYLKKSFDIR